MTSLRISTFDISDQSILPPGVAFNFLLESNVRTLNAAYSAPSSRGLLYVPNVPGACAQSLPQNVTRYDNLPVNTDPVVAIAPWISPSCTLSYLQAASNDVVAAFVFYIPDQTNPPLASAKSATWDLGDGGHWRSVTAYPVYAIASQVGAMAMAQVALYSGHESPDNHLRLLIDITTTSGGTNLPSIWIFLLIILAILIVLIGTLSLTMHIVQRKRRNNLRARIARGEVNLDALGLGKLTVPQEIIDQMYTYTPSANSVVPEKSLSQASPPLEQSTCAICLDDFTESECQVRELPCRHLFHNNCIDLFLLDTSSMCPLCKQSVLPKGYVPGKITNAHVRRERYLRRNAARRARHAAASQTPADVSPATNAPPIEMTSIPERNDTHAPQSVPATTQGRREWARRRALAMSGLHDSSVDETESEPRTSKARKFLRRVFPNL
ncbi:hypothetical protein E4T52_10708 [Aureobasidium sp. EXF-3400]|nr:hypothetical protein E4T51_09568 [Aureobasidium sp. EXF-12344]KAI4774308.1 hypothetical protein E4T52_10708 [Aureobasidium sp. EXF-3400]